MEHLQGVDFLPDADELDRFAEHRLEGKGGPAAGVTVHLGHDDAVDPQPFVEFRGHIDGILPGHGVRDEEDLGGMDLPFDLLQFRHHLFVDMEPSRRIDKNNFIAEPFGLLDGLPADPDGIAEFSRVENPRRNLLSHDPQLFDRRRPVDVRRNQIGPPAVFRQVFGQLDGRRRLSASLESHHHDRRRYAAAEPDLASRPAHELGKPVMDDLDHLLARRDALQDLLADGPHADILDKVLDDLEMNVRLEKRHADIPEGGGDVLLVQPASALELLEDGVEFFRQRLEHDDNPEAASDAASAQFPFREGFTAERTPLIFAAMASEARWASSLVAKPLT